MQPVVTPAEMRSIDAAADEPVEVLVERAGWAAATEARRLLGGVSGTRIVVIAGPGNNGADGRAAARHLQRWGASLVILDPGSTDRRSFVRADLVIDAAFGTGLRDGFEGPDLLRPDGTRPLVLAVDIPSGLDGLTGEARGSVLAADATVTFGAWKPGLLFAAGPRLCGRVAVAPIGLDCSTVKCALIEPADVGRWPRRDADAHKWQSAVWVVGGSPSLPGAPRLSTRGAARAGAGYVLASIPGLAADELRLPAEVVGRELVGDGSSSGGPGGTWGAAVLRGLDRVAALVVGPGLATDATTGAEARRVIAEAPIPIVIDAGALDAVAADPSGLRRRSIPAVLTPHDGEFARLVGHAPGPDRVAAAREAAVRLGAVVLLKGPATVVADPAGRAAISVAGDQRLATAGTGDVLAGIIGAGLALGLEPFEAAAFGAEVHGRSSLLGSPVGLVAGDLPRLVAHLLSRNVAR